MNCYKEVIKIEPKQANAHYNLAVLFKVLGDFENTINYTLGLSFVRTSPDHGTGYDIANKFIANETSLITAINYAAKI